MPSGAEKARRGLNKYEIPCEGRNALAQTFPRGPKGPNVPERAERPQQFSNDFPRPSMSERAERPPTFPRGPKCPNISPTSFSNMSPTFPSGPNLSERPQRFGPRVGACFSPRVGACFSPRVGAFRPSRRGVSAPWAATALNRRNYFLAPPTYLPLTAEGIVATWPNSANPP